MNVIPIVLDLAGAVGLLLWGVHMVQTGVQRAFGAKLRTFLASALRNRLKALLAGIGVTAVLQSSTATGLMVTGFAAAGLVELVPALAVMLGANVGTTLIVQVLSFDVAAFSPILVLAGVMMFRRAQTGLRDFGRVFIGLGLILLALRQFVDVLQPYEDAPGLRHALEQIAAQPLLDVVLAAAATWAAHSSVAIVLVIMLFAVKGVVMPATAFALVLGANLGTAINPVLEGATGRDPAAWRLPIGNLANRVFGVGITLILLPWLAPFASRLDLNPARAVADFHTAFNLALAAIFFPLLPAYAALLKWSLPEQTKQADPGRPIYLDPGARQTPVVALGGAVREALRIADVLQSMLSGLRDVLERDDRRRVSELRHLDDVLDRLNTALKNYVTSLDSEAMSDADHRRASIILAFATNLEQAGDVVDKGLLALLGKKLKRGLAFSKEGQAELTEMVDRLMANLKTATSLFMTEELRAARLLAAEKEEFRRREAMATAAHFERLRNGRAESAETSSLHLDAIRDLKRVNSHLVAAAAYPVLEGEGELLTTRLRQDA